MPNYIIADNGVSQEIENTSIYWRQLIIFNYDYDKLKLKLNKIDELVEFDLPSKLKVTSKLANGEFIPLTDAIYCPWLDKSIYQHFNVGYNKTSGKCCVTSFSPGDEKESLVYIKIANQIPCFYMDGTFGPNEMVFLGPENFEDKVLYEYKLIDQRTNNEYLVGHMASGRYFIKFLDQEKIFLNADPVRFYLPLPEEEKEEWLRKHTIKSLDNKTYIENQTKRFIERAKAQKRFKVEG